MYLTSQLDFFTSAKPGHNSPVTIIKDRTRLTQRIEPGGDYPTRGNSRGKVGGKFINPHDAQQGEKKNGTNKAPYAHTEKKK